MTDSTSIESSTTATVTVCCVTFNQADTIRRAVDSILNQQTDFAVELVIHDDVSTDGTREIVEEYANQHPGRVTALLPEQNQYSQGINVMAKLRQLACLYLSHQQIGGWCISLAHICQ